MQNAGESKSKTRISTYHWHVFIILNTYRILTIPMHHRNHSQSTPLHAFSSSVHQSNVISTKFSPRLIAVLETTVYTGAIILLTPLLPVGLDRAAGSKGERLPRAGR